jgi:hypothetical protein
MAPVSTSASPYFESLTWKPPNLPYWISRATICSMLVFSETGPPHLPLGLNIGALDPGRAAG